MTDSSQVAVVSGGTGHVGQCLVPALIEGGWHVVAPWRDRASWSALHEGLRDDLRPACSGMESDLTRESDVKALMNHVGERHGRIDALINLVGMFRFGARIHELTCDDWNRTMDVNLTSVFLCCKHVLPFMLRANSGCIVNITSKAAVDIQPGACAYAVAKSGVIVLTEALHAELKTTDIAVNAIMPGIIDTDATRALMPKADHDKWVKPAQIVETIVSLCSRRPGHVRGSVLRMFGRM